MKFREQIEYFIQESSVSDNAKALLIMGLQESHVYKNSGKTKQILNAGFEILNKIPHQPTDIYYDHKDDLVLIYNIYNYDYKIIVGAYQISIYVNKNGARVETVELLYSKELTFLMIKDNFIPLFLKIETL